MDWPSPKYCCCYFHTIPKAGAGKVLKLEKGCANLFTLFNRSLGRRGSVQKMGLVAKIIPPFCRILDQFLLLLFNPPSKVVYMPYSLFFSAKQMFGDSLSSNRKFISVVLILGTVTGVWFCFHAPHEACLNSLDILPLRKSEQYLGEGRNYLGKLYVRSFKKKLENCLVKVMVLSERWNPVNCFFPLKHTEFVFCMLLGEVQLGKEMEGKPPSACCQCPLGFNALLLLCFFKFGLFRCGLSKWALCELPEVPECIGGDAHWGRCLWVPVLTCCMPCFSPLFRKSMRIAVLHQPAQQDNPKTCQILGSPEIVRPRQRRPTPRQTAPLSLPPPGPETRSPHPQQCMDFCFSPGERWSRSSKVGLPSS